MNKVKIFHSGFLKYYDPEQVLEPQMFFLGNKFVAIEAQEENHFAIFRVIDGSRICILDVTNLHFIYGSW